MVKTDPIIIIFDIGYAFLIANDCFDSLNVPISILWLDLDRHVTVPTKSVSDHSDLPCIHIMIIISHNMYYIQTWDRK